MNYQPWPQPLAVLSLPQMQQRAREIYCHEYRWAIALLLIFYWLTVVVSVPSLILLSVFGSRKLARQNNLSWPMGFVLLLWFDRVSIFVFFFRIDPCLLSILNIAVGTCQSQTLNLPLLPTISPGNHKFILQVCESVSVL